MSDDDSGATTEVVVTPPAPAAPEYVTPGELDARLALHEERIGQRVTEAFDAAWDARNRAEEAADDAAAAEAIAGAALEVAAEAAETAAETAEDQAAGDEDDGSPKAPQKRESPPAADEKAVTRKSDGERGYGASFLR